MSRPFSRGVTTLALGAVYFGASRLGWVLAHAHAGPSPVSPAAGIALAAVLLAGFQVWPGIFLGAFLANFLARHGAAPPGIVVMQAAAIAAGNTLEALAGAHFARYFAGGREAFGRVTSVFHFSFWSAALAPAAGATIGSLSLLACGLVAPEAYGATWLGWWMGDMVGILVMAPLILVWANRPSPQLSRRRALEGVLLLSSMAVALELVFFGWPNARFAHGPFGFLLLPFVLWAALRFETWGTVSIVFLISTVAVGATCGGAGTFALGTTRYSFEPLLMFIGVIAVASLVLAAAVAERQSIEEQLRLANGRFQLALAASRMGHWTRELTGSRRAYWSPRSEMIFGLQPGEFDGSEEAFHRLIHPEDRERVRRVTQEAIQNRSQDVEVEFRFLRRDGSAGWVLSRGRIFYDENGTARQLAGVDIEITARKETEEALRQSQYRARRLNAELERRVQERTAQLEAANKELEAFCYSVSHDLRAPLRTLRGFSEVLLEQHQAQLDARGQDFLRRTCHAAVQMDRLVDDLLKLSRASRAAMETVEIHLSRMAEEIVSELHKSEPSRQVEFALAPDLKAWGDERLVRLVLDNLLRNAWKFTSKRTQGRIEFGRRDGEGSAFFVRDNGAGFDMAYVGKLFGVFQRLHSPSEFPGSGVGLALAQRVIARHNGRIWAEGKTDVGATFYFTLPQDPKPQC